MPSRPVVRLLLGALALAGLLAMHGLAGHGVASSSTHEPVHHATTTAGLPGDLVASIGPTLPGDHGDHTMAALCVGLLVGAALTYLLRDRSVRGARVAAPAHPPRAAAAYDRGAEPPDLHALCVQRC